MKFRIFFIVFILFSQVAVAQLSELGLITGTTYYLGDLNNKHFKQSKFSIGLLYRYNISNRVAFRLSFLYGNVAASDSKSDNAVHINRNLSFKSSIAEIGAMFEFNYYTYSPGDKRDLFTTYILAGISYFKMNPKAKFDDVWYELNGLGTEGQNFEGGPKPYKVDAFAIPVGLGAKVNLSKRISVALEYSIRFTFTDYLDDVSGVYYATDAFLNSNDELTLAGELADRRLDPKAPTQNIVGETLGLQRGDSSRKDWYGFAGIILSVRIGKTATTCVRWN